MTPDRAEETERVCLIPWGDNCRFSVNFDHECGRKAEHEGRHRCHRCRATTTKTDPIFEDPEELELAVEMLSDV